MLPKTLTPQQNKTSLQERGQKQEAGSWSVDSLCPPALRKRIPENQPSWGLGTLGSIQAPPQPSGTRGAGELRCGVSHCSRSPSLPLRLLPQKRGRGGEGRVGTGRRDHQSQASPNLSSSGLPTEQSLEAGSCCLSRERVGRSHTGGGRRSAQVWKVPHATQSKSELPRFEAPMPHTPQHKSMTILTSRPKLALSSAPPAWRPLSLPG